MILLLLLCACFGTGFSDTDIKRYGDSHRFWLRREAYVLEFKRGYTSRISVLWKRGNTPLSRGEVRGSDFVIFNLTQEDSGKYIIRDSNRLPLQTINLQVEEEVLSYLRSPGESLSISYNLSPLSCYIYFISGNDYQEKEIVSEGMLQVDIYDNNCFGFELLRPCGVTNSNLQSSCDGRLEIRDGFGRKALVVSLEMDSSYEPSSLGIGLGISSFVLSCCICLKRCCCGKSSSKEDSPETPDAEEPAVHYHEYDREPTGVRPEQVHSAAAIQYPTQTDPLIHSHPCLPPPYSEVSVPVEFKNTPNVLSDSSPAPTILYDSNPAPTILSDSSPAPTILYDSNPAPTILSDSNPAPTVLYDSNPEPQFELKGMSFASAPPPEYVYTSDKLNFP